MDVGTKFTRGERVFVTGDETEGHKFRLTMNAVYRDGDQFAVGCQTFRLQELLRSQGTIGEQNRDGWYPITAVGTVNHGEMIFGNRNGTTRSHTLAQINEQFIEAEVVEAPPERGRKVVLQPGIYFCNCTAHEGKHVFLVSVDTTTREGSVKSIGVMTRNIHLPEVGAASGATGFAQWPTCRPRTGHTYSHLFGRTTARDRTYEYEVTDRQFPEMSRV
jgi:hypothetical protein